LIENAEKCVAGLSGEYRQRRLQGCDQALCVEIMRSEDNLINLANKIISV
jgi:hypothetical protein